MKLDYLMRIKIYDRYFDSLAEQKIVWQILAENNSERDLIEFLERFLKLNAQRIKTGLITTIDSEMIFHASFLKKLVLYNDNLTEIFLSYIEEKGGILLIEPVITTLKLFNNLLKKPSKGSGIILSQKNLSEYFKEKI